MENPPIRYLMAAVVQEQDVDLAGRALSLLGIPVFHLASSGGFLGRRNATLMIGLPEGMETQALTALQKACRQRVEYLAIPLEGSPLPLPTPVPVTVGGATVFTLSVDHYEEF
ncbi:MAG: cyclic-di-AMP receptor [Anaerolineales bacterium]|nr:cyclic-di-AMP receptor [Anaerolineales bacterium]